MAQNPRLRVRLIGPSGHKTDYHCATLLGNWQEERTSFGLKDPAKEPLESVTTYKASYKGTKSVEELFAAKPPGCFCAEAPVQLLFYHGDIVAPPRSQLTVSELSYTDPTKSEELKTLKEILDDDGISKRQEKTNEYRRTMGFAHNQNCTATRESLGKYTAGVPLEYISQCSNKANDEYLQSTRSGRYVPPKIPHIGRVMAKERFLTTKNTTIDAAGEFIRENIEVYPATSSECWGDFMAYKDNPMQRTKLREDYEE